MKIQIIQLETHDDILSTRDKISWAKAARVLLVLPERNHLFQNKLDQQLILRLAQNIGAQIAFVSRDRLVQKYAKTLSIPTFRTITKATKTEWSNPPQSYSRTAAKASLHQRVVELSKTVSGLRNGSQHWLNHNYFRSAIFLIGVLAVLALASTLLPSAKITLYPDATLQKMTLLVSFKPNLESIRLAGEIPITSKVIRVAGTQSQKATGKISVPSSYASGEVLLTNLTNWEIPIPSGTIVTTITPPAHRYQIIQSATLAAGTGKTLKVPVKAVMPGSSENIPANAIQAVEGKLGLEITVTNPQELNGGLDQSVTSVSAIDQKNLLAELKQSLIQKARQQLVQALSENDLLLDQEPRHIFVSRSVFKPDLDQPANSVQLDLEIETTFAIASRDNLQQFARQLLDANLPTGYVSSTKPVQIQCIQPIQKGKNGEYSCKMQVERQIIPKVNLSTVQQLVMLQTINKAQQRIQSMYPYHQPAQIEINPTWWKFLPALPMRIIVEIKQ